MKEEYRPNKDISFDQANKKDAINVTSGKYTMSTTKKGKYIRRGAPYDVQLKKLWRISRECGRLTLLYRMGHTLEEMGVELRPTDWSRIIVKKPSSTSSSPSTTPTSNLPSEPHDDSRIIVRKPSNTSSSAPTTPIGNLPSAPHDDSRIIVRKSSNTSSSAPTTPIGNLPSAPHDDSRIIVRKSSNTSSSAPTTPIGNLPSISQDDTTSASICTSFTFKSNQPINAGCLLGRDSSKGIIQLTSTGVKQEENLKGEKRLTLVDLIATNCKQLNNM